MTLKLNLWRDGREPNTVFNAGRIEFTEEDLLEWATGKVYDFLFGRDFNGYSGKWNILMSGGNGVVVRRKESLIELEWRPEEISKIA